MIVARNEKRIKVADARRAELASHPATVRKTVKRKALPHGADDEPIRSGDPAAVEKIKAKIEALALSIDKAKAANAIIRRTEKGSADDAAMIKAVVAQTGMSAAIAIRGAVLPDWQWKRGFDTSGNRAEIRRLQSRLKSLARMQERGNESQTAKTGIGAFEIIENVGMARIQMIPGQARRGNKAGAESQPFSLVAVARRLAAPSKRGRTMNMGDLKSCWLRPKRLVAHPSLFLGDAP
ncbi:hypothetical protein NKI04_26335 [Mesorhizobium sp. M0814]|uniref:hypothetical protein n=1 Tax=Mesorhizobium sp. M0814 TaxID=2957004 RepID=UPI00333841DD